jgi:hypothetical protein
MRAVSLSVCLGVSLGTALFGASRARADEGTRERLEARLAHALAPRVIDGVEVRAWPRRPLLDAAREAVGAELSWRDGGTRGAGATVCVVDTGVDLARDDFRDRSGATRVRWLLDLDAPPRGVHGELERAFGTDERGAVWSAAELDAALAAGRVVAPDWNGHGTTVASAAAGDDAGPDGDGAGTDAGVAPEASLVVVRALRRGTLGLTDDDILRGARFCADTRVAAPERTVVVLALGGHDGPHDGTSPLERGLSAVARRGPAVVVAAGNDGARPIHASARLVGDEPVRLRLRVPAPSIDDALVSVVLRGAAAVRARPPAGAPSPWVARGVPSDDGALRVEVDADAAYVVWRGALWGGELVIEARGTPRGGSLDAWLVDARLGDTFLEAGFVGAEVQPGETVAVPATAGGVVAVGASVSRAFLAGETGPGLTLDADALGRARFSAIGPRVDGAPLPTVLGPGGWVIAALSRAFDPTDPEGMLGGSVARFEARRRGADRIAVAGTSIAAAVVGGAIALARAASPVARDERALLAASAVPVDGDAGGPFDARRGAGHLWLPAYLAQRAAAPRAWASLEGACTRAEVVPGAADVAFVARSEGAAEGPFEVALRSGSGHVVLARGALRDGWASVPVALPPAPAGSALVLEVVGAPRAACSLDVVLAEDVDGARLGGAGACASGPTGRGRGASLVGLGLAALTAWARRRRAGFGDPHGQRVP